MMSSADISQLQCSYVHISHGVPGRLLQAGKEAPGCMPCEESCHLCTDKIARVCNEDPCGEACQAYICCTTRWGDHAECEDALFPAMAQLAEDVTSHCGTVWTCDAPDLTCSESPEMCVATGSFGRRLQLVEPGACPTIHMRGAGGFDTDYALAGSLNGELVFKAASSEKSSYVLKSALFNSCENTDTSLSFGGANIDTIVSHSSSGYLAWDDGTPVESGNGIGGIGCTRHIWSLQDTTGGISYVYLTVDPTEHPGYITSDWVKLSATGHISSSELDMSCSN